MAAEADALKLSEANRLLDKAKLRRRLVFAVVGFLFLVITVGALLATAALMRAKDATLLAMQSQIKAENEKVRAEQLANQLGMSQAAVQQFLRIVGEQNVPPDRVVAKLAELATNYRNLQQSLEALDVGDPVTQDLINEAKAEINAGRFDTASDILKRAAQAEIAAANQAKELAQRASAAARSRAMRAAKDLETQGDIALAQGQKGEAANFFAQAAALIPADEPDERARLLRRQEEAEK